MQELHQAMMAPANSIFMDVIKNKKDENPFTRGAFLREPIFYGGESAYDFQYRDLSVEKYRDDNAWFVENKGFSIDEMKIVINAIKEIQHEKILSLQDTLLKTDPSRWTFLNNYIFSVEEINYKTHLDNTVIINALDVFTAKNEKNETFKSLSDFNITNAKPLLQSNENSYLLLQHYSLLEAFYESSFYWFMEDKSYKKIAEKHRGAFTENFSYSALCKVFGKENVFKNIEIYENKKRVGEIDVLVVYANRAIVLQAKSKRLTIEARKGNDLALSKDFKHAIQDSYKQGKECAQFIQDGKYVLKNLKSEKIEIRKDFKEVFIFCIISEHYPSLAFQSKQFLKYEESDIVKPPFIMDVFLLDVMVEFLDNPLYFLSYVNKRTSYFKEFFAQNELTLLSYHLKRNLYLDSEYTFMMIEDDVSADLDQAMMVRRYGIKGLRTPEGILTKFKGTFIGNFLDNIDSYEDDYSIEIGFFFLTLSEEAIEQINDGVEKTISLFFKDGKGHDFTAGFDDAKAGITIHTNTLEYSKAYSSLLEHCKRRKYMQHANNWFGLCVDPHSKTVKFGVMSDAE